MISGPEEREVIERLFRSGIDTSVEARSRGEAYCFNPAYKRNIHPQYSVLQLPGQRIEVVEYNIFRNLKTIIFTERPNPYSLKMAEGYLLVPTRSLSVGYGINMDQFCLVRTVMTDRFDLVNGSKKAVPDSIALSIGEKVMRSSEKPLSALEGNRRSFGEQDDFAITPEHFLKKIRSGVLAPLTRYDIGGGIIGLNPDNYPILPKAA